MVSLPGSVASGLPVPRVPSSRCFAPASRQALLAAALAISCVVTYLPAVNNGFISDDFIMLDYVEQWKADPGFLFRIAPDVFRLTSYAVLWVFTSAFGYSSVSLYAFLIAVHFVNCLLLFRLCRLLHYNFRVAAAAALLFSAVQKAQEAIMWLAAMAYALGGFCVLAALVFWRKGRHGVSSIFFLLGLFSTESVMAALLLAPLTDIWVSGRVRWRRQYLFLLAPPLVFGAVFLNTLPGNGFVHEKVYALGWHACTVFANSLFRLAFPTLVAVIVTFGLLERRLLFPEVSRGLGWMSITLFPFVFLTYQPHVPSRHNYVPVMGLALALACLLSAARNRRLAAAVMAIIMACNVSYIWTRKDSQYEMRALPTTRLLDELRERKPQRILVVDFPLNPWMAKMCARHVPGWRPELIAVNETVDACPACPRYRWVEPGGFYECTVPENTAD